MTDKVERPPAARETMTDRERVRQAIQLSTGKSVHALSWKDIGYSYIHGMKELLNLPPLVLKAGHLGRQWDGYRFGLGLVVEDKPTDFSCMSCGLCFSADIHVLCCRSKLLCREVQHRRHNFHDTKKKILLVQHHHL